jgi:hypothetical protein
MILPCFGLGVKNTSRVRRGLYHIGADILKLVVISSGHAGMIII